MTYQRKKKLWERRRQKVVAMRGKNFSFAEIGREMGCSRERARQLYNKQVEKTFPLQAPMPD